MTEKPSAGRRGKKAERPAARSPVAPLLFYAEPGLDLAWPPPAICRDSPTCFTARFSRARGTPGTPWRGPAGRHSLRRGELRLRPSEHPGGRRGRHREGVGPTHRRRNSGRSWVAESFACGECSFRVSFGAAPTPRTAAEDSPERVGAEDFVAKPQRKDDSGIPIVDEPPRQGVSLPSPSEQLQAALVRRLKALIPVPPDPEGKAEAALALNRGLNQAFWDELRGELVPLIKPLLQDIPNDYEGKRSARRS